MPIFAIDPGTDKSALCRLWENGNLCTETLPNRQMLLFLRGSNFLENAPLLAVEMIASYGMPVGREVFETCLWIGRFIEAWKGNYRLVYRRDVKMHICHSAKANDANIRQALIDRYGPGKEKAIGKKSSPGPLFGVHKDEWAALAVAVTAMETPQELHGHED